MHPSFFLLIPLTRFVSLKAQVSSIPTSADLTNLLSIFKGWQSEASELLLLNKLPADLLMRGGWVLLNPLWPQWKMTYLFFGAHPYPAPNISPTLTKNIQLNWQLKDKTSMLWEHNLLCCTKEERMIFLSNSQTLLTHHHTWHVYPCSLFPQSFHFVIYTYIYFFCSVLCMGVAKGKARSAISI